MNKFEISIVILLSALLLFVMTSNRPAKASAQGAKNPSQAAEIVASTNSAVLPVAAEKSAAAEEVISAAPAIEAADRPAEEMITLKNAEMELTVSSYGAELKCATLLNYRTSLPKDSPAVTLLGGALALAGDFSFEEVGDESALLRCGEVRRRITLKDDYIVEVCDENVPAGVLSLGVVDKGDSKSDVISADAFALGGKKVARWGRSSAGGGCSGAQRVSRGREIVKTDDTPQEWVALKTRFFVQAFKCDAENSGYELETRDGSALAAELNFSAPCEKRTTTVYAGPKMLSLVEKFGTKSDAIMEFGTWHWLCKPLLWTLTFFHRFCHNYGLAIILLTILVRAIFWPLQHRSNESMKKMQAIQPQIKALQEKYKSDPQRLQQETMLIYRENKVNPMSSCLPMLVQIPVFIALFTVLRTAIELRFAGFCWIADLSEPENLFAGTLPVPLNILPFAMAGTMWLQSKLMPSAGDPQQQRMMAIMMPVMMFFMFYSFSSGLLLYWVVSQIIGIIQIWQRRTKTV